MCDVVCDTMVTHWTDDEVEGRLAAARRRLKECEENRLTDVPIAVIGLVSRDVPFLLALVDRLRATGAMPHA